jgi:ankyrin repeat protein
MMYDLNSAKQKYLPIFNFIYFSYLLEHGADPLISDAEGNIALHWAALSGSKKTCELLLNHGCDVNATNSIGETPM